MGPNPPCEKDTLCGDWRGRCPKSCGLFTISDLPARPSAGIGVVDVQKLRTFYDFCGARATLCVDWRGRCPKTETLCVWRDRCAKNCGLFTISDLPARPSAGICVVDVQKLRTCPRDPLQGLAWWIASRSAGLRVCLVVARLLLAVTGPGLESCLVSAACMLDSQQRESG